MTERIRTTISLSPEALEIFKRMADAGNMSVSRCMGDWLTDTADAAEMITLKMEEAKQAPMKVLHELKAFVTGLGHAVAETGEIVDELQERERTARATARTARITRTAATDAGIPPSSNTGGKSPKATANPTSPKG